MKDQADDARSPIILWALGLTAVLLGVFAALLSFSKLPQGCTPGWWLLDRLGCLEPNALGDTFAGAFAPVAFVWLVTAVFLQRNELAAQRQELRESRAVAGAQVEETRKNVQFIAQQTEILRAGMLREEQQVADQRVTALVRIIVGQVGREFGILIEAGTTDEQRPWAGGVTHFGFEVRGELNDLENIRRLTSSLPGGVERFVDRNPGKPVRLRVDAEEFARLLINVENVDHLGAKVSGTKGDQLFDVGFGELVHSLNDMIAAFEAIDPKWKATLDSKYSELQDYLTIE